MPYEISCANSGDLHDDNPSLYPGRVEDIELDANGQDARFIDEVFTQTDTTDFVGSVRCSAPSNERFTGVAIEMNSMDRIFTTLPVVPVQQ